MQGIKAGYLKLDASLSAVKMHVVVPSELVDAGNQGRLFKVGCLSVGC